MTKLGGKPVAVVDDEGAIDGGGGDVRDVGDVERRQRSGGGGGEMTTCGWEQKAELNREQQGPLANLTGATGSSDHT